MTLNHFLQLIWSKNVILQRVRFFIVFKMEKECSAKRLMADVEKNIRRAVLIFEYRSFVLRS